MGAALGAGGYVVAAGAATERVTLTVRPTTVGGVLGWATAFGAISSGDAGEQVVLEARDCGQSAFRLDSGPRFAGTTGAGGAYSGDFPVYVSRTIRARWKSVVSNEVTVKRSAIVTLRRRSGGRLWVAVWGIAYFEGKRVRIERWDRQRGRWVVARRVALRRGVAGNLVSSEAELRLAAPKGTQLRAVFPAAAAAPCYLAGVSMIVTS